MLLLYFTITILQVKLGDREQKDIINELRTTQNLRHCLDDVEIIIGFLSSGGADANIELRTYVKLKMDDRFKSKKVSCISLCVCICVNGSEKCYIDKDETSVVYFSLLLCMYNYVFILFSHRLWSIVILDIFCLFGKLCLYKCQRT